MKTAIITLAFCQQSHNFSRPFMRLLTKLRWGRNVFARNLASIKDSFFLISGKFITLSVMLFHWRCQILGSLASRSHGWPPIFSSLLVTWCYQCSEYMKERN